MIKKISKVLALITIVIYAGSNFAAVVSDNDGSAFITKAEFDSLKNNFQSQLDSYNSSIDSKIDSAIASYLSGIKVERITNLENKYQTINPVWMKNKRFNKSKKGTKYTSYISFVEICTATNYTSYVFEGTGNVWYWVKDMTYNEDDQEYLYRISKKKIGPFDDAWSLQDLLKSDYSITVVGGASGGRGGSYNSPNRLLFIADTTLTKESNIYFSTWYAGLPIEIWDIDPDTQTKTSYVGNIGGTTGNGEEVAVSAVASDVVEDDETIFYLAGGSMENDVMYCINSAESSIMGDTFATANSDHGSTRQTRLNDEGTREVERTNWQFRDYGGYVSQYDGAIHAEVYRHKLTEINSVDLLNEVITQNTNVEAYYYSGCPLFTATADNAVVKFKIKFNNTVGARTKWALKDGVFSNEANPGNASGIEDCSEKTFLAEDGETVTVKFKVKKNKTYWIKADPEAGYTAIEFDGDIVQIEES